MSDINPNNNCEVANSGKLIPSGSNKILKVEISEDARSYILARTGVITVDMHTTYG